MRLLSDNVITHYYTVQRYTPIIIVLEEYYFNQFGSSLTARVESPLSRSTRTQISYVETF